MKLERALIGMVHLSPLPGSPRWAGSMATVIDRATFAEPTLPAAGIAHVFVNGRKVWSEGTHTGARAGRALRRQQMQADAR